MVTITKKRIPRRQTEAEKKAGIEKNRAFIEEREKKASQAMHRFGISAKEARKTATENIEKTRAAELAGTPQAIAQKQLDVEGAKERLVDEALAPFRDPDETTGTGTAETEGKETFGEGVKERAGNIGREIAGGFPVGRKIAARILAGDPFKGFFDVPESEKGVIAGLQLGTAGALLAGITGITQAELYEQQIAATIPSIARITQTVTKHELIETKTGGTRFVGRGTVTQQRAFTGRPGRQILDKLPFKGKPDLGFTSAQAAARFAVNTKTIAMSTKILTGLGFTAAAAGLTISVVGTYPFAGFIQEEALQTLSFGVRAAQLNNDLEGQAEAIALQEEIQNHLPTLIDKVPFLNVQIQLRNFNEAARIKLDIDKRILGEKIAEEKFEEATEGIKERFTESKG